MMYNKVINHFLTAANDVFNMMFDMELHLSEPKDSDHIDFNEKTINAQIEITGNIHGAIIYSFDEETILEIVKIMSGMEFSEIDEFVTSALGEIANIISGNALTTLEQNEIKCDINTPEIIIKPKNETSGAIVEANAESDLGNIKLILRTEN